MYLNDKTLRFNDYLIFLFMMNPIFTVLLKASIYANAFKEKLIVHPSTTLKVVSLKILFYKRIYCV